MEGDREVIVPEWFVTLAVASVLSDGWSRNDHLSVGFFNDLRAVWPSLSEAVRARIWRNYDRRAKAAEMFGGAVSGFDYVSREWEKFWHTVGIPEVSDVEVDTDQLSQRFQCLEVLSAEVDAGVEHVAGLMENIMDGYRIDGSAGDSPSSLMSVVDSSEEHLHVGAADQA